MIWDWVKENEVLLWWLVGISVFTFAGSLIAVPLLIVRIPADYFMPDYEAPEDRRHPVAGALLQVAKNVLGLVVFLAGVAMLFIPGQGLLTMLLGLALIDFPGKRELEIRLLKMPKIRRAIDWVRRRYGREPLEVP